MIADLAQPSCKQAVSKESDKVNKLFPNLKRALISVLVAILTVLSATGRRSTQGNAFRGGRSGPGTRSGSKKLSIQSSIMLLAVHHRKDPAAPNTYTSPKRGLVPQVGTKFSRKNETTNPSKRSQSLSMDVVIEE
ncbi:hypothetical protein BDR07DRAFT_1458205 [Suillus spraguei]|nr:hypothetical protein BDR07DRAFT_1458205 [Suillus spraguei]